jgi:glutamate/tyrosine decarboxylase-like PLP-dependent enzyme
MEKTQALRYRIAPLEMTPSEFRKAGYRLIDQVAELLCTLPERPVAPNESPATLRALLGSPSLPEQGRDASTLLVETANLLFDHSVFNGHPRFMGFITSSAAPIGTLGELLATVVNPNVGSSLLAPIASEIEAQVVRWIAEMIGYPADCGGLLVSGGNMANCVCFLAARKAKACWDVRTGGMNTEKNRRLRVYTSRETHTWIQKAADMFGLGTDAIRWISVDEKLRMDTIVLRTQIQYEYGPQNSRGFRALKVWLALRQAGREGYKGMISDDIQLAQELYRVVKTQLELQAFTQDLSITTFRYVPPDLLPGSQEIESYLNALNAELLTRLQKSGEAFLSNAVIGETFVLSACIVNFRTSLEDIEALPGIVIRIGREVDAAIRPGKQKDPERNIL